MKNKHFFSYLLSVVVALALVLAFAAGNIFAAGKPGDVDGDGIISPEDARRTLRASVQLETLTKEQTLAADVDGDSLVTSADARMILRAAIRLEPLPGVSADNTGKPDATPTDGQPGADTAYYVPTVITVTDSTMPEKRKIGQISLRWANDGVSVNGTSNYSFDTEGRLTYGTKSLGSDHMVYTFRYEDDILRHLEGKLNVSPESILSESVCHCSASFDKEGRLTEMEDMGLTSGLAVTMRYGEGGTPASSWFGESAYVTETVFRYEDPAHPGRITAAELTNSDYNGTAVLTYSYTPEGTLAAVTTEKPATIASPDGARLLRLLYTEVRFSYDKNGCLTGVAYRQSNSPEMTNHPVRVSTTISYQRATAAQYRAFRDLSACSGNNLQPGIFMPTRSKPLFNCFSLLLTLSN